MRKRRKLLWQLFPSYFVITVVAIAATAWYASAILSEFYRSGAVAELKTQALMLERIVNGKLSQENSSQLDLLLKDLGTKTTSRWTVLLPSGNVIADSQEDPAKLGQRDHRPEIAEALAGRVGVATRHSYSLDVRMIYVAVPVKVNDQITGVVRAAMPFSTLSGSVRDVYAEGLIAGAFIIVVAIALSFFVSRRINTPLREMRAGVERFAVGDLHYRLAAAGSEDFAGLAEAMNSMASQLSARISKITQQRNELEAVLSSMVEAVLVIDSEERLLSVNHAAEVLFNISGERLNNRTVQEVIRNTELHRFVSRTLAGDLPVEGDLTCLGDPDKFLQAHGAILSDSQGRRAGAVVVLNDVSRLKTLENIRRDFVANVSHELKTPITSIQGFLETLREGAINDPATAGRFLDIIIKHTNRLSAIIEDLLSLSRIERDHEKGEITIQERPLKDVFEAAKKSCGERARQKDITLEFLVDDDLTARINPTLLEQAIVNLVDNSIKYSEPGNPVLVQACKGADEVVINITDKGCGISKEHLKRIFERFYRVDKARSRRVGGTGLGLAIVRHIVNAHNGRVTVQSSPGRGSTFSIHLPVSL